MRFEKYKILLGFVFLFTIYGCSIPTDFYIQNHTKESKIITIKYQGNIKNQIENDSYGTFSFNYKNGIVNPKEFKRNKNLLPLNKTIIGDYKIEIVLPASSTTRIEKTHNFGWSNWSIDNIKIDDQEVNIKDIQAKSIKIKDDYVYKIE